MWLLYLGSIAPPGYLVWPSRRCIHKLNCSQETFSRVLSVQRAGCAFFSLKKKTHDALVFVLPLKFFGFYLLLYYFKQLLRLLFILVRFLIIIIPFVPQSVVKDKRKERKGVVLLLEISVHFSFDCFGAEVSGHFLFKLLTIWCGYVCRDFLGVTIGAFGQKKKKKKCCYIPTLDASFANVSAVPTVNGSSNNGYLILFKFDIINSSYFLFGWWWKATYS